MREGFGSPRCRAHFLSLPAAIIVTRADKSCARDPDAPFAGADTQREDAHGQSDDRTPRSLERGWGGGPGGERRRPPSRIPGAASGALLVGNRGGEAQGALQCLRLPHAYL